MENINIDKKDSSVFVSRSGMENANIFLQLSFDEIKILNHEVSCFLKRFDSLWLSYNKVTRLAKETTDYKARSHYLSLKVDIDKQLCSMKEKRDMYLKLSHILNASISANETN